MIGGIAVKKMQAPGPCAPMQYPRYNIVEDTPVPGESFLCKAVLLAPAGISMYTNQYLLRGADLYETADDMYVYIRNCHFSSRAG